MKICKLCQKLKEDEDFYLRLGRRIAVCKQCQTDKRNVKKLAQGKKLKNIRKPDGDGMVECRICHKIKHTSEYRQTKRRKKGYQQPCKQCNRENRTSFKRKIERRYKISFKEYEKLLKDQENKCLICKKEFIDSKHTHIDHNHTTNEVRGLLCHKCNSILGYSEENIEILKEAINYLEVKES